jgi:peptidoglycan/LPS O-acetylase OafA/YrhL
MLSYRREIDGLRALAVVPVIFFHGGFEVFSGGFVGVDVFFVISGFLITSIIIGDIESEKFSIWKFYERRVRRILPALFVVTLLCVPPAWLLMLPVQQEEFGKSVVAVNLFISNFLFWSETGYFQAASEAKPLLHTWSLAVEEQYYLLFPLFMLLLWKRLRKIGIALLAVIVIASFLLAEWTSTNHPTAGFFLLPTRAWELLVGSLGAVYVMKFGPRRSEVLSALGVVLIVGSIFLLDSATPFPGVYALAPVLGTALLLIWGSSETVAGKILGLPVFVGIGLISYSAYLFHQPLFAFLRIAEVDSTAVYLAAVFATFVLAAISWKFVETPARRYKTRSRNVFAVAGSSAAVIFMLGGGSYFFSAGIPSDYRGKALAQAAMPADCDFYEHNRIEPTCISVSDEAPNLLLWGDSHAWVLSAGVRDAFEDKFNVLQVTTAGCRPQPSNISAEDVPDYPVGTPKAFVPACQKSNAVASALLRSGRMGHLVVAMGSDHSEFLNPELVEFVSDHVPGGILLVGPTPQWNDALPRLAKKSTWVEKELRAELFQEDSLLVDKYEEHPRVRYVSLLEYLCDLDNQVCLYEVPDAPREDRYLVWDYGHLSLSGSLYVGKHLRPHILAE